MNKNSLFSWDEEKNKSNIKKHGLSFTIAMHVFEDPLYVDIYDEEHSDDEERHKIIGLVGCVICVICVIGEIETRIISCRKATKEEEKFYYDTTI